MRKLDIFNHIWPKSFHQRLTEVSEIKDITKRSNDVPMMVDLDERFRVMDMFDEYQQILSLASPPLEIIAKPEVATELARIANDGMAELVGKARTMLVVSHALGTIKELCDEAIWLHRGRLIKRGEPDEIIAAYTKFLQVGENAITLEDF